MPLTRIPCGPSSAASSRTWWAWSAFVAPYATLFGPANSAVLAGDVDDVAAHPLRDHRLRGGPGDQERALGHHVVLQVPVGDGGLQQRLGDRQPGVVDHQVDPAERQHGRVERGGDRVLVGHVGAHPDGDVGVARSRRPRRRPCRRPGRRRPRTRPRRPAAARSPCRSPTPAPVTSATRVASGLGCGHPGELGLLQGPVLDAELLRLRDRGVGRHRLGAAHHVDRVDVELARHPGGLLVAPEGEHARRRARARWPGRRRASAASPGVAWRS